MSHSLNVLLGIIALIPWITVTFNDQIPPPCDPDFGYVFDSVFSPPYYTHIHLHTPTPIHTHRKWNFSFGVVALTCPFLHGVFSRFEHNQGPLVGGRRASRPFYEWICIFGGAFVLAFNWVFNLGWALLALPSFVSNRFYRDETLSTWCQREHDIGVIIILTILTSISIVLLCSCIFSIRFLDVLIRNWYRKRGVDEG